MFVKIEKTRSAAADDGCTSNICLKALYQLGSSNSWECHHSTTLTWWDTSSAAARNRGSSAFSSSITGVEFKKVKVKVRSDSRSDAVGFNSNTFEGEKYRAALKASRVDLRSSNFV